jgi:predicted transposase
MKLTLQIQLLPDNKQADQLKSTMERFKQACSWLAEQAFEINTARSCGYSRRN